MLFCLSEEFAYEYHALEIRILTDTARMEPDALMKKQDGPACFKRNSATDIALSKKDCAAAQLFFRTLFAKAAAD